MSRWSANLSGKTSKLATVFLATAQSMHLWPSHLVGKGSPVSGCIGKKMLAWRLAAQKVVSSACGSVFQSPAINQEALPREATFSKSLLLNLSALRPGFLYTEKKCKFATETWIHSPKVLEPAPAWTEGMRSSNPQHYCHATISSAHGLWAGDAGMGCLVVKSPPLQISGAPRGHVGATHGWTVGWTVPGDQGLAQCHHLHTGFVARLCCLCGYFWSRQLRESWTVWPRFWPERTLLCALHLRGSAGGFGSEIQGFAKSRDESGIHIGRPWHLLGIIVNGIVFSPCSSLTFQLLVVGSIISNVCVTSVLGPILFQNGLAISIHCLDEITVETQVLCCKSLLWDGLRDFHHCASLGDLRSRLQSEVASLETVPLQRQCLHTHGVSLGKTAARPAVWTCTNACAVPVCCNCFALICVLCVLLLRPGIGHDRKDLLWTCFKCFFR